MEDHRSGVRRPRVPAHEPIAAPHRRGSLTIAEYSMEGHLVWAATDAVGIVALAGSQDELERALTDFDA